MKVLNCVNPKKHALAKRFRGLLPIVIDVETSGLNPLTDAILELSAVTIGMDQAHHLIPEHTYAYHVEPFLGARIDPESLAVNGIDPLQPLRFAMPEKQALHHVFSKTKKLLLKYGCQRAVLVGHNAWFDLQFLQAAAKRNHFQTIPFHSFTSIDTASLSALMLGETVLAKAMRKSGIPFDVGQAHSATYDAEKTAELFCLIVNTCQPMARFG